MDEVQVGSAIRAVRLHLGLRQSDVAARAGVSHGTVSLVERGLLGGLTLRTLRCVAAAVGVSVSLSARWRGADLAKLLDERHALMVRDVVARVAALGWQTRPEHTFSLRGERGSIDILAWQAAQRALLLVEVKTRIVDLQDLLSTMDRKRRLAPALARELGWEPVGMGSVLVLPDDTWARRVVVRFGPLFESALPARTVDVRRWLARPERSIRGVWFLPDSTVRSTTARRAGRQRIRTRPGRLRPPVARSGATVAVTAATLATLERTSRST